MMIGKFALGGRRFMKNVWTVCCWWELVMRDDDLICERARILDEMEIVLNCDVENSCVIVCEEPCYV